MALQKIGWQKRVITILENAIRNGKVANAYLFSGPPSVGKTEVSKLFSKSLNCEVSGPFAECDCNSCNAIDRNAHPDVISIEPDGAKLKVDQIRDLKEITRYGPAKGKWQVIIVHDAERFTTEASNSFLKLLEEPPDNVVFVLITTNISAIIPTIRSRAQLLNFTQASRENIRDYILQNYPEAGDRADRIAGLVQGDVTLAGDIVQEGSESFQMVEQLKTVLGKSVYEIIKFTETVLPKEKDDLKDVLDLFIMYCVEALKTKEYSIEQRRTIRRSVSICLEAFQNLTYNINARLHMESAFLAMRGLTI